MERPLGLHDSKDKLQAPQGGNMERIVDTRGLACPEPVILTKKALEEAKEVLVIADNDEAVENIRRLANKMGCAIAVAREEGGAFRIRLTHSGEAPTYGGTDIGIVCGTAKEGGTPLVIVLSSDRMGRGNDELGEVLMRSFVHTLLTLEPRPAKIILYNTGVRLASRESALIDDLKQLEAAGVELFVCGTCVNYFELKDELGAGIVSNMYDIAAAMTGAGKLVIP
jgi:selenium metabolism protein YedF